MQLSDYELYIFDFDGTLSMPSLLVRLTRYFKKRYNIDFIKKHEDLFNKELELNDEELKVEREERFYSSLYNLYSLFFKPGIKDGSEDLLKMLKERKKKIALFSDGKEYRIRSELAKLRLEEYFDILISADSINIFKPNPTPLLLITKKLRVPKEKSIYIGDMPVDVFTAKFARISSCVVADGLASKEMLKKAEPDFLFDNIKALRKALSK
ncbi:MAG: HAD hydrolase-like protein [Candidatus Micrarchaeota archaeon]